MKFNIRTRAKREFDLAATVTQVFIDENNEEDEIDVMDFEGDDAVDQAKEFVFRRGVLGEIT